MEIMRRTPWSRIRWQNSVYNEFLEIVHSGKPTGSVLKETIAVSVTTSISVQIQHSQILLQALLRGKMRVMRREPEVPEARVPVEECFDCLARFADLEEKCSHAHRQVEEQPGKRYKRMVTKAQWLCWKLHDNWVAYYRIWSRRSFHRFHGRSSIRKPIQRVKFAKAVERHADIRDQYPSLGMICPGDPHQRNANAPKFEDWSQEETEWQERCAREAAWRLAKKILKFKEKQKAAFFSLSENWCLLAPWNLKLEEREFVVHSGASMRMISKKDFNSAEMDTLTRSCSPTIVTTANGEVQTHEEATVYVKELDTFLTMKVLENTPAVLSLGKLCDEHGYSHVVPALSTSPSSRLLTSPPMTPLKQEIDHSKSSSSLSFPTPMTSSTEIDHSDHPPAIVSDESVDRQERRDPYGTDHHPAIVSTESMVKTSTLLKHQNWINQPKTPKPNKNENHEREREDPSYSDIPEWLQEFRENLVDDRVPERRDSHASFSHEPSLEPMPSRSVGVFTLTSFENEIARSVRGPKLQESRAEDALAEPYLVQKILVIWLQQITKFSVKVVNFETIIDMQSWCRIWPPSGSSCIRAKQKLLRKQQGACKSSWSQMGILKSFTLTIPLNLAKFVKISTPHCRIVAIRSRWKLVDKFHGMLYLSAKRSRSLVWWETPLKRSFGKPIKGPIIPIGSLVENFPVGKTSQESINLERNSFLDCSSDTFCTRVNLEGWHIVEELETMDASENYSKKLNVKEAIFPRGNGKNFQPQMDESHFLEEIRTENIPLDPGKSNSRKRSRRFSWRMRRFPDAGEAMNDFW